MLCARCGASKQDYSTHGEVIKERRTGAMHVLGQTARKAGQAAASFLSQFDVGLRQWLGDENNILYRFVQILLYVALPSAAITLIALNFNSGLIVFLGVLSVLLGIGIGVLFRLAKNDMFFTFVEQGTAKIVTRFGGYRKTLLAKKGYKLTDDDNVVELAPGERSRFVLPGGLRFVGIWPMEQVYTRNLKWTKAKSDGTLEEREASGVNFILVRDYVYGLRVANARDADCLPLDVLLALTAQIVNPYKATFSVNEWFLVPARVVRSNVERLLRRTPYFQIEKAYLEKELFTALEADGDVTALREGYGIELRKVEVIEINPPDSYRQATLEQWQAR